MQRSRTNTEAVDNGPPEVWIKLTFSWSGKSMSIDVAESDRVFDLKAALLSLTNVPVERQKILGLVKGKLPPDEETIASLKLTTGKKFMLVGTPVGDELKDPSQVAYLPDVFNDLDIDFTQYPEAAAQYANDRRNQRKVREATSKLHINIMEPLRSGKKLLVLDIDYTILDTKPLLDGSLPPMECTRPYLHKFLEEIYPHYDICVWSQTSWVWLEAKLHEIGMIGGAQTYKVNFVLDSTCMFKVFSSRDGKRYDHHVKPLQIIWNKFPQFNASNTIHVDDLGRNFALNPGQGLKISAFKNAKDAEAVADRELQRLARYMVLIATIDDLRTINHKDWKKVARSIAQT